MSYSGDTLVRAYRKHKKKNPSCPDEDVAFGYIRGMLDRGGLVPSTLLRGLRLIRGGKQSITVSLMVELYVREIEKDRNITTKEIWEVLEGIIDNL